MKRICTLVTLFCLFGMFAYAQPTYYMDNLTVDDCKGFLLDSENGDVGGNYDHNENFTFSICIPGVPEITLNFTSFCTELDFDYMRFYDGPDTLSAQIGPVYTGEVEPPPITATSGCLTVNFISDPSVTCTGWFASWCVEPPIPEPVPIETIGTIPCESNSLIITFAEPIPCNEITAAAFSIIGPQSPSVISATPSPCTGGTASTVVLTLDNPISSSGNYTLTYTTIYEDPCTDATPLVSQQNFSVVDCPLSITVTADANPICEGACTFLLVEAFGGGSSTYNYNWNPSLPNSTNVEVCPNISTTYTVTVTDNNGASAVNSIFVEIQGAPTIINNDTTICQSADPFFLTANPVGGTWSANGIDEDSQENGYYDPSLVPYLRDTITYADAAGCSSRIFIDFTPLDQGNDDASCPGEAPFYVSGGLPVGGTWSGLNITTDGLFTPPADSGSFLVTYTHPNGCAGSKWINVGEIEMPALDSICQSTPAFMIPVTPFGGTWAGTGIVDEDTGMFDPEVGIQGDNVLVYTINGCVDSINLIIKAIDAAWDFSACPDQAPFILEGDWNPTGGLWSGAGIIDPLTGLYDPSILPNFTNDTLLYFVDGCIDSRIAYIRQTEIYIEDTIHFCVYDDPIEVSRNVMDYVPCCGIWTGAGMSNLGNNIWQFDPEQAGVGTHNLTYAKNDCSDFMTVMVHASPIISPLTICEGEFPINLVGSQIGIWTGTGIVNNMDGVFDPIIAGVGVHTIYLENTFGCIGQGSVNVTPFMEAVIDEIPDYYCYKDTLINIPTSPAGGQLTINGVTANFFNPASYGEGIYNITYSIGAGQCLSETNVIVEVGSPIVASTTFLLDSICYGNAITIAAEAIGSSSNGQYTYTWTQGLGFGKTHFVDPTNTTTYIVSVADGCSDPATATTTVFVHDQIQTSYTTGPEVCFDESTFATITASPGSNYTYVWDSEPPTIDNTIQSYPTSYNVEVTNNDTGCSIDTEVDLAGYDLITANFDLSPNTADCISTIDPTIQLIDFSVGATGGYWDFGDGSPRVPYVFGESVNHTFPDTVGNYNIILHLENEGDCISEDEVGVCIKADYRIFAPNAMTPNLDGKNDFFQIKGLFIKEIEWQIFDRWGQRLFTGTSLDDTWDGFHKGTRVQVGVYVFIAKYTTKFDNTSQVLKGHITVLY